MYKPKFNSVLVEIDDKDAQWGGENNENMLGKSYSKGKFISITDEVFAFRDTKEMSLQSQELLIKRLNSMVGQSILWNEGVEAGTTFEEDGKLYGFIYWWDIRACKE